MLEKYVCIVSQGHSGSTLLSLLLDRLDAVTNIGRVMVLQVYANNGPKPCTCGVPVSECEFWQAVEKQMQQDLSRPDFRLADSAFGEPREGITLADPAIALGSRLLWRLTAPFSPRLRRMRTAARNSIALFEAVARLEGTPIVIDSSNVAARMKSIAYEDPDRLRVIRLVRDGRAVSRSQMKREQVPMTVAAKNWRRKDRNMRLSLFGIPKKKMYTVRYEGLCADVEGTIAGIADFLGIDGNLPDTTIRKQGVHTVSGNPMRFRRSETEIKLDEKWREELSEGELQTFERICGKENRSYGFV